jgi:lipopolysaccharide/colanic/teichoic acid biosynthesis glycosyltransferase
VRISSQHLAADRDEEQRARRILIVGAGPAARALALEIEFHFPNEYQIVGYVDDGCEAGEECCAKVLGSCEDLPELVARYEIDEVVTSDCLTGRLGGVGTGVSVRYETRITALNGCRDDGQLHPISASEIPLLTDTGKRVFDVLFSLAALLLMAPIAAFVAAVIKLTSPGPVFYTQERVGRGGRHFTIYKFRTMINGAENGTGPTLSRQGDARSTPLGRILRATKLDEWPQFYNVLKGDMSVVGPRPERPFFVQAYNRHIVTYAQRHCLRPGITGLAQVCGGYLTHAYVKLHYDLLYVYNHSLWLDLCILARTPLVILRAVMGRV